LITGLNTGFYSALRAMQTAQFALSVTSSNIAHANDPNYTRRQVNQVTGNGVDGPTLIRLRNVFIDDQYRNAYGQLGEAEVRQDALSLVEDVFGDPVNGGLRTALDNFFTAWKNLAENPTDDVARIQVMSTAYTFAATVKSDYNQLQAIEDSLNEKLSTTVDQVNTDLQQIYDLNIRISALERNSLDSSDLRDQRDQVLDDLAKLTGAIAQEKPDGTVRVSVGPTPVIDGPTLVKLQLVADPVTGKPTPTWMGYNTPVYDGRGAVYGLMTVRDNEIATLKQQVDTLGKTVAQEVNNLHQAGRRPDGQLGGTFFLIGTAPADIIVDPNMQAGLIAAGSPTGSGQPSDGVQAKAIADLVDSPILTSPLIPNQQQTPQAYYRDMVGWLGTQAQEARQLQEISKTHVQVTQAQRQSEFGVSLDEETANLAIQQRAFEAASRVIAVMDQMMDTLINRTG